MGLGQDWDIGHTALCVVSKFGRTCRRIVGCALFVSRTWRGPWWRFTADPTSQGRVDRWKDEVRRKVRPVPGHWNSRKGVG